MAYLLNAAHPDNGGKAAYFAQLGFTARDWEPFAQALRQVAITGSVSAKISSAHGIKYVVDGQVRGAQGETAPVRTIWIMDHGLDTPRLVTAYPYQGDRK